MVRRELVVVAEVGESKGEQEEMKVRMKKKKQVFKIQIQRCQHIKMFNQKKNPRI